MYTLSEWHTKCSKAAENLPPSECPSLNIKIHNLLKENPLEAVVDMEEEPIEVEKWVANEGQLYIEFD